MIRKLRHLRIELALHELRAANGRALLLLHGLAERSPSAVPVELESWPGPIHALDFTGHGQSTVPPGGGYTCELLMGDVDTALGQLGEATLVGRGLGAYVATLVAGGRPEQVRGAILRDGPGLAGGATPPGTPQVPIADPAAVAPPDPYALAELSVDARPGDYATSFVRQATHLSGLDLPLWVCAAERTGWLRAVVEEPGVATASLAAGLAYYAALDTTSTSGR